MLTATDYKYLKRYKRVFKQTRAEAEQALTRARLSTSEQFVQFQTTYGGYRIDDDLLVGIVDPSGESTAWDGGRRQDELDGKLRVRCDWENLTQIRWWLDETGVFYFEDYAVAESFESYIRFLAYIEYELKPLGWTRVDASRADRKRYREFLRDQKVSVVAEASDAHHQIRRSDDVAWIVRPHFKVLLLRPDAAKNL